MKIILDYIKDKFPSTHHSYIKMFITEYDNIDEYFNYDFLLNGIKSTLQLLKQKSENENHRITFYDSQYEESKIHILEIVHNNRPFLIDSINNYFKFIKAKITNNINFTIKFQRNAENKLEFNQSKRKSDEVIVMQIIIENLNDDEKIKNITTDVEYILNTMNDAIDDWSKIIHVLRGIKKLSYPKNIHNKEKNECMNFIDWLIDKKFIFLGLAVCDYHFDTQYPQQIIVRKNIKESLGIARSKMSANPKISMYNFTDKIVDIEQNKFPILKIVKSRNFSLIHRSQYMDCIKIKRFNNKGEEIGEFKIFGMFSSIVHHQDALQIPLVNRKIKEIEKRARFSIGSQNNKNLISVLQDLPRDNLFQNDSKYLHMIAIETLKIIKHPNVKVFLKVNCNAKFINCLVLIPYNIADNDLSDRIAHLFKKEIDSSLLSKVINVNEFELIQMQLAFSADNVDLSQLNLKNLEEKIINISKNWADLFYLQFNIRDLQDRYLLKKYQYLVPQKYQRDFDQKTGKRDIKQIEILLNSASETLARFYCEDARLKLFIYTKLNNEDFTLSSLIPIVDNMGMNTIRNNIYQFEIGDQKINMHSFDLQYPKQHISSEQIEDLEQLLTHVLEKNIENDILNKLVLEAELQWRQIILLRGIIKYLKQMNIVYSIEYIQETLLKYPQITHALLELFRINFSPECEKNRKRQIQIYKKKFEKLVFDVPNITEENIFNYLKNIIDAIMRTNFYQTADKKNKFTFRDSNCKRYISFKIKSDLIKIMPLPKPFSEIFVYSKDMEGIHLRGGKVARGGIRWSDRLDDFRNEVLGLMKAQVTKNTVIVPTGAKGGFIIKNPAKNNPKDAVDCYRKYLHGILDIMDNIDKNGKIKHPKNVVIHDEHDYYIVAAADKGTATFSNHANEVAKEFNFWLQDAFASGGSNGYDHKQMAITSRGGWISVIKHFASLGKDISKEKFTVAGIGDMSGDVFGNGMLLSKNILLVAAFNHKHIFLDPNPDNLKSYQERKRLFDLLRSNWTDYNQELISKGGGVFERSAKKIPLSPQICKVLHIKNKELAPNDLIKAILKAPLELLWNGGIGTYVKAESETHACTFDKANDALRINGNDLQVNVIGEGGNLGFTQLGRIEFAQRHNKKINTDFIDNSAGVDCSDHEVNIKIALIEAVKKEKITLEQRNELMAKMTDEVAEIVLHDNHMQNFAITMIEIKSQYDFNKDVRVLRKLEEIGLINRAIDFLPDDKKIDIMLKNGQGFSRPEICVLLSYVKMFLYDYEQIYNSNIVEDPIFNQNLLQYFPQQMQNAFTEEIMNHKLKREIIATYIVNEIVNYLGINFIFRMIDITNSSYENLIRTYFIIKNLFNMNDFWHIFETNIFNINGNLARYQLLGYIDKFFLYNFCILLPTVNEQTALQQYIDQYQSSINILRKNIDVFLPKKIKNIVQKNINSFVKKKIDLKFIQQTVFLDVYKFFPNIININKDTNYDLLETAKIYFVVFEKLMIHHLNDVLYEFHTNYWDAIAAKILISQLNDHHITIVKYIIQYIKTKKVDYLKVIEKFWNEENEVWQKYFHFVQKYIVSQNKDDINLGNLNVVINKISSLITNLDR